MLNPGARIRLKAEALETGSFAMVDEESRKRNGLVLGNEGEVEQDCYGTLEIKIDNGDMGGWLCLEGEVERVEKDASS